MPLKHLDHVNIRTTNLEAMRVFYRDVLGLREGERPAFSFPGSWLYLGDRPCVHLVEVARAPDPKGELRLEHFSFAAEGKAEFLQKLRAAGIPYRESSLPGNVLVQVNVWDPDGNHLHVDFLPNDV
jgi:catechol 2,3-dioxygenase-like lactoylglutathione lyase family enzyme